ncbi:hypothetical protein VPNG_06676 [Cytospora leucostoma]|uniref:Uncharacterized protein n=1 Tax=Cytospora leucostoma TaxID=1230097 RepID=A0A423WUM2_9PEZI|nr:hypothetical protein VPNG_06676 [Cytospora leucostoma]
MSPFPFLVDPVATFIVPRSRKLTSHRTKTKTKVHHHNTSNGKGVNSKVAIALICVGVALIVIGIAMSVYFRRRKAKQNAARSDDDENDREVGMSENLVGGPAPSGPPAYSSDANGGLYGGGGGGGGAAAYKDGSRSSSEYGSDQEGRNLGGSRKGGYSAVDTGYDPGAGEAASYYSQGLSTQPAYDHVPQRPPMAFKVSPTPV